MSEAPRSDQSSGNQGIQARTVKAKVIAVGEGATAQHIVYAGADVLSLSRDVGLLRKALDKSNLPSPARSVVEDDVVQIEKAVASQNPDPQAVGESIKSLAGKLKMVGIVLSEVAALGGPVKSIATTLGISLPDMV